MRALLASSIVILLVPPAFAQTLFSRMVSENNLLLHEVSFSEDYEAGAFGMEGCEEQLLCTYGHGPAPGSLPMGQVVSLMDLCLYFSVPLPEGCRELSVAAMKNKFTFVRRFFS